MKAEEQGEFRDDGKDRIERKVAVDGDLFLGSALKFVLTRESQRLCYKWLIYGLVILILKKDKGGYFC